MLPIIRVAIVFAGACAALLGISKLADEGRAGNPKPGSKLPAGKGGKSGSEDEGKPPADPVTPK